MAPLRSAIIGGMNFIFLSLSRPAGRDKLIFTQMPKRIAAIGGTLSGGAGIEQSEMTERGQSPESWHGAFDPGQAAKIDFREAEPFQIVFSSGMEYNETMNILPRLRLRYGRNLI